MVDLLALQVDPGAQQGFVGSAKQIISQASSTCKSWCYMSDWCSIMQITQPGTLKSPCISHHWRNQNAADKGFPTLKTWMAEKILN